MIKDFINIKLRLKLKFEFELSNENLEEKSRVKIFLKNFVLFPQCPNVYNPFFPIDRNRKNTNNFKAF